MSDLCILQELLSNEAMVILENDNHGKKKVTLIEPECYDHKGYSITINNMPVDSVVIKADFFPPPRKFFKNTKGECKRADFVIITNTDKKNLIIIIEMKKSKKANNKIIQQLKGARCVIDYCRSIVHEFWQKEDFLNPKEYVYRFVSISGISSKKKPIYKLLHGSLHDSPERMLIIKPPHNLQFRKLAGSV
jgi:hypothetical protein